MMRSSSSKRHEFFWPRQVLRKLLNLKQSGDEFNADEDAAEDIDSPDDNESSDSSEQDIERRPGGRTRSLPPLYPNASPAFADRPKQPSGMLARGQSETLWTQFVDLQDYRIHVGTWNVAGKCPTADLDLKEWLDVDPATDMYVIGFQEVVPLNAGNVLGATDEGPAVKWEALIRKTLNGSHRRSRSAPASPAAVHPADIEHKVKEACSFVDKQKDDRPRRRSSSNSSSSHHRRTHSASAQAFSNWSIQRSSSDGAPRLADVLIPGEKLAIQVHESPMSPASPTTPSEAQSPGADNYVRIVSKQMVGIYISVWIRKNLRRYVHNLKVSCVGCGLMGYYGNKGSITVSMLLHQTSLCFVCTHLTSGEKEGDELRRNADVTEILRRTLFLRSPKLLNVDLPETILQHDRVIWLGDLNYRLSLGDSQTRALIAEEDWETLLESDQLKVEQHAGRVFEGWEEGTIDFAPTYKYLKNSDRYFGENSRPGDKRRTPSWCDRILWRGRGLRQMSYVRTECRLSDHRPVKAMFMAEVEVFSNRKLKTVARLTKSKQALASCSEQLHEEFEQAIDLIRSLKQQESKHDSAWLAQANGDCNNGPKSVKVTHVQANGGLNKAKKVVTQVCQANGDCNTGLRTMTVTQANGDSGNNGLRAVKLTHVSQAIEDKHTSVAYLDMASLCSNRVCGDALHR